MPLKSNRKMALTLADKQAGRYHAAGTLVLEAGTLREVYLTQYGSDDWRRFCRTNHLEPSMSRRGN